MNQRIEFPAYTRTNENLRAIVLGLDIVDSDRLFMIGGSGDQSFAALEFAGRVVFVDNDPNQINLALRRKELLRSGNNAGFLESSSRHFVLDKFRDHEPLDKRYRDKYFSLPGRLEKIAQKLDALVILESADFIDALRNQTGITKIYASNALGYNSVPSIDSLRNALSIMADAIPIGGLIYVANHSSLCTKSMRMEVNGGRLSEAEFYSRILDMNTLKTRPPFLPQTLEADKNRSAVAKVYEPDWYPAVYVKVCDKTH